MSIHLGRWDSTTSTSTIMGWDQLIGQPSGYTRHYLSINGNWDGGFTKWSLERNRIPIYGIHSWTENRQPIPWADVADGRYDAITRTHAGNLRDLMISTGATCKAFIGWHHEPENEENGKVSGDIDGTCGTPAEAKAAGERFLRLVAEEMGDKVRIGATLMKGSYSNGKWVNWMPQNAWWMGVDGYSHGSAKETFANLFTPSHQAAVSSGRKLIIQEVGAEEVAGLPSFKASFFNDARYTLKDWTECRGIEYSNVQAKGDYRVDTSTQALDAFRAWAQDSYYVGEWT